jgi:hypothetical protein
VLRDYAFDIFGSTDKSQLGSNSLPVFETNLVVSYQLTSELQLLISYVIYLFHFIIFFLVFERKKNQKEKKG